MQYLTNFGILPIYWYLPIMYLCYRTSRFCFAFYMHRYWWHNQFEIHEKFLPIVRFWLWIHFPVIWTEGVHVHTKVVHIKHHMESDTDKDPHSPLNYSMWECIDTRPISKPLGACRTVPPSDYVTYGKRYGTLLEPSDKYSLFFKRYRMHGIWVYTILWTILAGWPGLLFGLFFRYLQSTWQAFNSCYMFHTKPGYQHPNDTSLANQCWPWPVTEGLHSNHHANPQAPNTAYRWFEIDFFYWQIKLLSLLGLVKFYDKKK